MTELFLILVLALGANVSAAKKALENGHPQEALKILGDAAGGDDPAALAVAGRAFLQLGRYETAVEPLLRASDANPKDGALARDAALACYQAAVAGTGMYARAYLDDASRVVARTDDPLLAGKIHEWTQDFASAAKEYAAASEREKGAKRLEALLGEARSYQDLGKDEESQKAYAEALGQALDLGDLAAAWKTSFRCHQTGRFLKWLDEQIAQLEEESAKDPGKAKDLTKYRLYRGSARAELTLWKEAEEDLRFVVGKEPENLDAKTTLGLVLFQRGAKEQQDDFLAQGEKMLKEVDTALHEKGMEARLGENEWTRLQTKVHDNLMWLGNRQWLNGDLQGGLDLMRYLAHEDPQDVIAALNVAAFARRLGLYDEATKCYEGILAIYPDDPDTLNDYGILLDGLGKQDEAVKLWKKALDQDPGDLNALENLTTVAWERGDLAWAKDLIGRGLKSAEERNSSTNTWRWFRDRLLWCPKGY